MEEASPADTAAALAVESRLAAGDIEAAELQSAAADIEAAELQSAVADIEAADTAAASVIPASALECTSARVTDMDTGATATVRSMGTRDTGLATVGHFTAACTSGTPFLITRRITTTTIPTTLGLRHTRAHTVLLPFITGVMDIPVRAHRR